MLYSSETLNEDTVCACETTFLFGSFYAAYDTINKRLMLMEKKPRLLSYLKQPEILKEVQLLCTIVIDYDSKTMKECQTDMMKNFLADAGLEEELGKNLIGKMFSS